MRGPLCSSGAFIALCAAPTPRFRQLLLTQADKFSVAEVRVPGSLLGRSSRRHRRPQ